MKCIFGEENQQFQYSVAVRATKPIGGGGITSYLDTGVFTATNDDEANGIAYRLLHQRFPIAEGYGDHQFFTIRTEELTDHAVEANKHHSCYTRCLCGALLHCHDGVSADFNTRRTKLETAVYNLQSEGYTKKEIMGVAEMYFPGEP